MPVTHIACKPFSTSDEWCPDLWVIGVTKNCARTLLFRMKRVAELYQRDSSIAHVAYWHSGARVYDTVPDTLELIAERTPYLDDGRFVRLEPQELSSLVPQPVSGSSIKLDLEYVVISFNGLWWRSHVKGCNTEVSTPPLYRERLHEIAGWIEQC